MRRHDRLMRELRALTGTPKTQTRTRPKFKPSIPPAARENVDKAIKAVRNACRKKGR